MSVPSFMAIRLIAVKIFHSKTQIQPQGITKIIRIHHLGTMNVFMPIHPVDVELFHRIRHKFDLLLAVNEQSAPHQSVGLIYRDIAIC